MPAKQAHIASLDGLRFLAALSVLISHAAYQLYPPGNGDGMSRLAWNLTHLASFGMTLFFVLSGFVIHWNYRQSVQEPGGLRAFFIARWSRLYPLFLVMFVVGITGEVLARGYFFRVMLTTPFFLTFTSTWWYWQIDGLHIFEIYNHPAIGVMWSLATEAFFYAAYPLLAPMAARLSLHRSILSIGLAGALAAATALGLFFFRNEIAAYAAKHFNVADTGQFIFWLGYTSPWMRLSEFLLGVFTAQLVLAGFRLRPPIADAIGLFCFAAIAAIFQMRNPLSMTDTTLVAPCFAGICLAAASDRSRIGILLSAPLMVWGGEASYSLYLLHGPILILSLRPSIGLFDRASPLPWFFLTTIFAILIARFSYASIERPGRRIFRALASKPRAPSEASEITRY